MAEALEEAGACVAEWQPRVKVEQKSDKSPVTEADLEANEIIFRKLSRAFPEMGYLSEEGLSCGLDRPQVFAVDPLDGTREYVQGRDDFAVSIGLLEQGEPVAGGIFVVRRKKLFLGRADEGVTCNGVPVVLEKKPCEKIAVSRTEMRKGALEKYPEVLKRAFPVGSIALKFTLLLENQVQGYCSLFPKGIWDLAGGHALLRAAKGAVVNLAGEPLHYALSERICREGLVAGHVETMPFLLQALSPKP